MKGCQFEMTLFYFFLIVIRLWRVSSHGRLIDPPARSSCWREFPKICKNDFTDNQMFCGGKETQWNTNGGKCGICGDSYSGPRNYELGGKGYTGFVVRSYSQGAIISVRVELTANHLGWFEFRICNADHLLAHGQDANQNCLNQNLLKDQFGNAKMLATPGMGSFYNYKLILPTGLICHRCVFQWKYRTGNSWGVNPITGKSCLGCGSQEEFYGCSDISIGYSQTSTQFYQPIYFSTTTLATTSIKTWQLSTVTYQTTVVPNYSFESNSNVSFICPNNGLYPNYQTGCREFYSCWHVGTRWENVVSMSCPAKLIFDNRVKSCNYEQLVDCFANKHLDYLDNIDNFRDIMGDFIYELKTALLRHNLILSITIPSEKNLPKNRQKAALIINNVDYINLIGYDIHGSWESDIRHHSPLFGSPSFDVNSLVKGMLNYGVPRSKLVLGMALYGRTFRKKYFTSIKAQSISIESGISGKYSKSSGMIGYFEICELTKLYGWTRIWDNDKRVPILYRGNDWIGYEDQQSLIHKTKYVKYNQLGGVMFWDLSLDDYSGAFCNKGRYHLIKSVKNELFSNIRIKVQKPVMFNKQILNRAQCWNGDGFYPDYNSGCTRYYRCSNSYTHHKRIEYFSCPTSTLYDQRLKTCTYKNSVVCKK